jgi:hypothetical protein
MKKPRSTTQPTLYSINGLSEQTGVDRRTIKKRLRDIPPRKMDGVSAMYALEDLTNATAQTTEADTLKEQKLSEEVRKLRIKNDKDEGKLVARTEVASAVRRALAQVATLSESKLVNEYPTAVAGLDCPQARVYGKRLHDALMEECQKLAKEFPE